MREPSASAAIIGTFEIHIFVDPLDPDPGTAAAFDRACRDAGEEHGRMKGLLLNLDFQHVGFVGVLQSSRYCTGTLLDARRSCARDAEHLTGRGFRVIREKIEAVAGNEGVPDSDEAARLLPDHYFEYHLLIDQALPGGALTGEDEGRLRDIAAALSAAQGGPIPLSYNAFKPGQRFLNVRTYGLGRPSSYDRVAHIEAAVNATGSLRVVKVIREFICADSNKGLDAGWLEPLQSESCQQRWDSRSTQDGRLRSS